MRIAMFSLALPKMGSFPMFFTNVITDGWICEWKKQVETMKVLSKKLGSGKVVLVMGNSASARVPNLLTQAG